MSPRNPSRGTITEATGTRDSRGERYTVGELTFSAISRLRPEPSDLSFVLVHGIGASHRYLDRLADRLTDVGNVYLIDLPGFGGLTKPGFAPSVPVVSAALGTVLERLGVRDAVIVGHSMGAQWAVEAALILPSIVRSVVAIGPVTDRKHRSLGEQSLALAADVAGEPVDVNAVVAFDYFRCGPSWYLREARHMIDYRIDERVPLLDVPLLVIRGGNDPIAGLRWCRELRDRARQGRLVIVPGHRHVVQQSAPRAVASAIIDFVGTTAPKP